MSFGCPEFCWWLNGYLADYSGEELTPEQEKKIIGKLKRARTSINLCNRPSTWDSDAESVVDWLYSRMDTFAELKQKVPVQIVTAAKTRVDVYAK